MRISSTESSVHNFYGVIDKGCAFFLARPSFFLRKLHRDIKFCSVHSSTEDILVLMSVLLVSMPFAVALSYYCIIILSL
jgi:hypothetical protein